MGIKTVSGRDPRSLVLNNLARKVSEATGVKIDDDPAKLPKNHMRLFAYYKPSLEAGQYTIDAEQTVTAPDVEGAHQSGPLYIYNCASGSADGQSPIVPQTFNVIAPQFSLDPTLINSFYPPDGHQDEARILPHMVFNDPHVPWERDAGETITSLQDPDLDKEGNAVFRNMVPWLALLVFDPAELKLEHGEGVTLGIPSYSAAGANILDMEAKVPPSGSYSMSIKDYLGLNSSSRINYEAGYTDPKTKATNSQWFDANAPNGPPTGLSVCPDPTTVIFPTKKLFRDMFVNPSDDTSHNINSFRYMSHVRQVNTVGCPDADLQSVGMFSIVVSLRTGNFTITQPTTQVCHLVSLEHIDSTWNSVNTFVNGNAASTDRIGLISLFSWIYTALPPNPVNFIDTMTNLVQTKQTLRVDNKALRVFQPVTQAIDSQPTQATLDSKTKQAMFTQSQAAIDSSNQMLARLKLGYTLSRWRAETGEEVAAFNRGPLVPQPVPWPPVSDWPGSSNTSKEYQILDKKTGLMDLSYSSAWQLGKLLAISDTNFNSALMRFRSLVHSTAASTARAQVNNVPTVSQALQSLPANVGAVHALTQGANATPQRVPTTRKDKLITDLAHPKLAAVFNEHLAIAVNFQGSAEADIYNEYNLAGANNTDWVTIFTWLSEKLYLSGIPAHYLIPEPSYLPSEGLRFFNIDKAWIDCLIDGALSVANHLDHDADLTRMRIKQTFNVYLSKNVVDYTKDDGTHVEITPQIPCSGFILKSALVKVMPDLRITITWQDSISNPNKASVCRYTKLDDTTILCLLDESLESLVSIELAQPPHQQRFSLGYQLQASGPLLEFKIRQLYTLTTTKLESEWPLVEDARQALAQPNSWFNFNSRCLDATKMANDINKILQKNTADDAYVDKTASSVVLGLELNDPSYYFLIVPTGLGPDGNPLTTPVSEPLRQLWVGPEPNAPQSRSTATPSLPSPIIANPAPIISQTVKPPSHWPGGTTTSQTLSQYLGTPLESGIHRDRRFSVSIYADYKGPPRIVVPNLTYDPNDYLPTQNTYFYDLIFCIRKFPSQANSTYQLVELAVEIPTSGYLADPLSAKQNTDALLDENYLGPGVRMLSNQRFVPLLSFTADYLQVRLIPRSRDNAAVMVINDSRSKEMSFRLAEANVSPVSKTRGQNIILKDEKGVTSVRGSDVSSKARVNVYERYRVDGTGVDAYVRYFVDVVKWEKGDTGH